MSGPLDFASVLHRAQELRGAPVQRFTPQHPCPICGGHDRMPRGQGVRCHGFLSENGRYAHCSREEYAGGLDLDGAGTYAHRLDGPCRCGAIHGSPPPKEKVGQNGHRRRVVREERHVLRDRDGSPLFVHRRNYYDDGDKSVWWERLDGTVCKGDVKAADLPLYGIQELGNASEVIVTEGEPARDALVALGIPAVGIVVGAPSTAGAESFRPLLAMQTVYCWPDPDKKGQQQLARTLDRLRALGHPDVRVITWPEAGPKDDAADFVRAGGTADGIRRLMDAATRADDAAIPPADAEARPRLRFVTARAFAAQTPEATEWAVRPWVPVGGLTKIDGPPKRAGKTTLIVRMIAAVLDGVDFLGESAKQGPVILLTEQGGTSLREALAGAGLLDRDDLHLALYRDVAALAWPDVVADTFALAAEIGAVLIVVDTLPACARVRGDDENSSGRALAAVEPLQLGADLHRIGVVLSFHDRKGGGEVGESGRGSSAYAGAVDVIVHLDRPGGNVAPTIRRMQALSRFEATPAELYIELTPNGYVMLGDADDVVRMQVAGALADALPTTEETAIRVAAVTRKGDDGQETTEPGILDALAAKGVKAARSTVDEELRRWGEAGYVGRTGEGKRGSAYRYWLVAKPPVSFFRLKPSPPSEESNAEGPKVSSDAHPPSEERNGPVPDRPGLGQKVSSDAPDGYNGRNQCYDEESELMEGAA